MASQVAAGHDRVCLEKSQASPMSTAMSSLGENSFKDQMRGRSANKEHPDPREERKQKGCISWRLEHDVPDVGGLGWRSKTGHLLKNQAYYRKPAHQNLWDDPVHAGVNTWKAWHGPRLNTDAPLVEKMDFLEAEQKEWQAKKAFVNTTRVQTLDRFYNRKLQREQYEHSSTWAPHHRARVEVHDYHGAFDGDINTIPVKSLKHVLTPSVLAKDKEAIKAITKRIQNEETWKMAWKMMEAKRREDIAQDIEQRRMFNDVLTQMAGQPPRFRDPEHHIPNECTERIEELAKHKEAFSHKDVTTLSDYRGLVHVSNQLALETLFPGSGHKESTAIKERANARSIPGYPPPRVDTPEPVPEDASEKAPPPRVSMSSVPASKPRVSTICTRTHDEVLASYAKEQYLPCQAPPAPNQCDTLLKEDWSKATTHADPKRMTGTFQRKNPNEWEGTKKSQEHLPPPLRQFHYPMLAPLAEKTRAETERRITEKAESRATKVAINEGANQVKELPDQQADSEALPTGRSSRKSWFQKVPEKPPIADKSGKARPLRNSAYRKAGAPLSARGPSPSSVRSGEGSPSAAQMPLTARDLGYSSLTQGFIEPQPSSAEVCKDLDAFEAVYEPVARLGNFFSAPHVPRVPQVPTSEAPAAEAEDPPTDQPLQATGMTFTGEAPADELAGTAVTMTPKAEEQAPIPAPEPQEEQRRSSKSQTDA